MFSLANKIIVVTGSSGLLGKEVCSAIEKQGGTVIGADLHNSQSLQNFFELDITSEHSVERFVSQVREKFGRIDGWINNAYPRTADWGNKVEDVPFKSWQKNVDMHLNGYYLCCVKVIESMKEQRSGCVINMSSIYGHKAPDFSIYRGTSMTMPVAYSAIKGAIENLTRYLASYFGPYNVRVNSVSPGGVFADQPQSFVERYEEKVPLRRMGHSADIASAICFLLSDEASYITGHNLVVDGGWSIV